MKTRLGAPLIGQLGGQPFGGRPAGSASSMFALLCLEQFDTLDGTTVGSTILQLAHSIGHNLEKKHSFVKTAAHITIAHPIQPQSTHPIQRECGVRMNAKHLAQRILVAGRLHVAIQYVLEHV